MNGRERILLVGGGNMGQALLRGWLADGRKPEAVHVVDPEAAARAAVESLGVAASPLRPDSIRADAIVLAVKPQQLKNALPGYRDLAGARSPFLSIAAGKRIEFYEAVLGAGTAIVRGMPNTPAAIGQGMTVLVANGAADRGHRQLCESLMAAVGQVAWLQDEDLMDAVTAVSGSGPAYVFLLIECLAAAAVEVGLDKALANRTGVGDGFRRGCLRDGRGCGRGGVASPCHQPRRNHGSRARGACRRLAGPQGVDQRRSACRRTTWPRTWMNLGRGMVRSPWQLLEEP